MAILLEDITRGNEVSETIDRIELLSCKMEGVHA